LTTYFSNDEDSDYDLAFSIEYSNEYLEQEFGNVLDPNESDFILRTDFNQLQLSVVFSFVAKGIE
jgi:hypothetical protein